MKCYLCISVCDDKSTTELYSNLLTVALRSAHRNTSLDIVVLYDGPKDHSIYKLLLDFNVKIIPHQFSHYEDLIKTYTPDVLLAQTGKNSIDYKKLAGTFMRFDIPFIETEDEFVLYSDVDVIFNKDVNISDFPKFDVILAGPELYKDYHKGDFFNAGILVYNVKKMRIKCEEVFSLLEQGIPNKINIFDQGYLNQVCENDFLPLEFNWKPYWGYNKKAKIIHFHGVKPGGNDVNSGFAVTESFYKEMFRGHLGDFPGYLVYLKKFFSYLEKNYDDWICEHGRRVLQVSTGKKYVQYYNKLRNKYIKYTIFSVLTFYLVRKFRIKKQNVKKEIDNFFN